MVTDGPCLRQGDSIITISEPPPLKISREGESEQEKPTRMS